MRDFFRKFNTPEWRKVWLMLVMSFGGFFVGSSFEEGRKEGEIQKLKHEFEEHHRADIDREQKEYRERQRVDGEVFASAKSAQSEAYAKGLKEGQDFAKELLDLCAKKGGAK